jgi:polyferredoxin
MKLSDRPVQRRGSWKRVIWYLILLAIILILIWQMPAIVRRVPM